MNTSPLTLNFEITPLPGQDYIGSSKILIFSPNVILSPQSESCLSPPPQVFSSVNVFLLSSAISIFEYILLYLELPLILIILVELVLDTSLWVCFSTNC